MQAGGGISPSPPELFDWSRDNEPNTPSFISSHQTAMEISEDPSLMYADLRSASHASKRSAQQSQKYYGFRSGPMSRIGQPVIFTPNHPILSFAFIYAPLLLHPETGSVRPWTKHDQFEWRAYNIWPLAPSHKVGRWKRRRCCYVPPRWEMERRMKWRQNLVRGDELEMEEDGIADAAWDMSEAKILDEGYVVQDEDLICEDENLPPLPLRIESSDAEYDMLSDLSSETGDSDWEVVDVA